MKSFQEYEIDATCGISFVFFDKLGAYSGLRLVFSAALLCSYLQFSLITASCKLSCQPWRYITLFKRNRLFNTGVGNCDKNPENEKEINLSEHIFITP